MEIIVTRWTSDRVVDFFHPSGEKRKFETQIGNIELGGRLWIHEKMDDELGFAAGCDLIKIAHCVGLGSTIKIGELSGIITIGEDSDGWTYPSGIPIEPEWFWMWHPNDDAIAIIDDDLAKINPLESELTHFKKLVPYQLARRNEALSAIPLTRLPSLIRPEIPFLFEQAE